MAASTRSRRSQVNGNSNGNGVAVAPKSSRTAFAPKENIFLFWPNIIGYSRIVLALISLYYMPIHPRRCCFLYSVSCLLDAVDGYAARKLEQATRFGAVLDMVTDRCATSCLLVFLASAFPRWSIIFQLLISLDFGSHWIHMYATLSMGAQGQSHKKLDSNAPWIMRQYYGSTKILFSVCALNELFFLALYLLSFSSPKLSPALLQPATPENPSQIFTTPFSAGAMELARANKMDSNIPWAIAIVSSPVMIVKQIINVIQLREASKWLAEGDLADRQKARQEGRLKAL